MTRTHYEDLDLTRVVHTSRLILVVKKEKPFQVREMVPIHEDAKLHPPYPKNKLSFRVLEILFDNTTIGHGKMVGELNVEVGSVIEAVDHEWGIMFDCYKMYQLENRGKSPIIERYTSSANLEKESEFLLFVSIVGEKEVYYNAYESMSRKDDVLKLIKGLEGKN